MEEKETAERKLRIDMARNEYRLIVLTVVDQMKQRGKA